MSAIVLHLKSYWEKLRKRGEILASSTNNAKFVIDSNSFIAPFKQYYSMSHFPSYWAWIEGCLTGTSREIVIPEVVYKELSGSGDQLSEWIANRIQPCVFKGYEADYQYLTQYGKIMNYLQTCGYYRTAAIANWSQDWKADPKLIAMAAAYGWQIITFEQPAGQLSAKNPMKKEPKIPNVASVMGVGCISLFQIEDRYQLSV